MAPASGYRCLEYYFVAASGEHRVNECIAPPEELVRLASGDFTLQRDRPLQPKPVDKSLQFHAVLLLGSCLAVIRCLTLHLDRELRRSLSLCSEVAPERERG
jgi:hypothetical protein